MTIDKAPDIQKLLKRIVKFGLFPHVDVTHIICVRSLGAKSRARARIWSFPKIWQFALHLEPHYVIEFLTQHFDHLSDDDKARVVIHELMHIPKNFSGALVPHRRHNHTIDRRSVEKLFSLYKNSTLP